MRVRASEIAPLRALAASIGSRLEPVDADAADDDVSLFDYFRLLQRLSIKGRDETCHLSLRPLAPGTTDFVVDTLHGADDLESVMKRIARAYNLVHGGFYNRVERRRDRIAYVIDDREFPYSSDVRNGVAHAAMEGVLIFLHATLSLAVGDGLSAKLRTVCSRRVVRAADNGLLAFWTIPVRCNARTYALEYDLSAAAMSVRCDWTNIAHAADVYEAVATMIVARDRSAVMTDFPARVADAIAGGATEQPQAARCLGVSVATLRRRLSENMTSFRDLRVHVLNRTAQLLLEDRRHASDVAETLGFADGRSFARAFKAWNGITPVAFAARLSASRAAGETSRN